MWKPPWDPQPRRTRSRHHTQPRLGAARPGPQRCGGPSHKGPSHSIVGVTLQELKLMITAKRKENPLLSLWGRGKDAFGTRTAAKRTVTYESITELGERALATRSHRRRGGIQKYLCSAPLRQDCNLTSGRRTIASSLPSPHLHLPHGLIAATAFTG